MLELQDVVHQLGYKNKIHCEGQNKAWIFLENVCAFHIVLRQITN